MSDFQDALAEYNEHRQTPPNVPFCHAPFVNMHFLPAGKVVTCCFNSTYELGRYPAQSVEEIWNGDSARELRRAMGRSDLTKGCGYCARQLVARDFVGLSDTSESHADAQLTADSVQAEGDQPDIDGLTPARPRKLEFELDNICNLECVMCHGLASSRIRKNRDAMPTLSSGYDDAFVDQLSDFIPGLREAGFSGGEPFMNPIYYKIWEQIRVVSPETVVMIVTNGTILDDRVRRVAEDLTCLINVSVDSIVEETYESIRIGSSLGTVLENSRHIADLMARKGLPFIWRCCVMRQNWHEMPDMVRYCDDNGIRIVFNQVEFPLNSSLHSLPKSTLQQIVVSLGRAAETLDAHDEVQRLNHEQFRGLIDRLAAFLEINTWKNALLFRLTTTSAIDFSTSLSTPGRGPFPDDASDRLARVVTGYVATAVAIGQAEDEIGRDALPSEASEIQSGLLDQLRDLRANRSAEAFLHTLLHAGVRAYVRVAGMPAGHTTRVFDRIAPLVRFIEQHPERERIIDELLVCPPDLIYRLLAHEEPGAVELLLSGAST